MVFDDHELKRRVDEVLYYVWDPVGVSGEPNARYEYRNYVGSVLELVLENDSIEPVSTFLANIESAHMGFAPNREQCDQTADLLLRHKEAVRNGSA